MTDLESLHRAVLEFPDDDLARTIYADYLIDSDHNPGPLEPERSEFIRVGVELAKLSKPWCTAPDHKVCTNSRCVKWRLLRRRERELQRIALHQLCEILPGGGWDYFRSDDERGVHADLYQNGKITIRTEWTRGFISHLRCSWQDFQRHAPALLWCPARKCENCSGEGRTFKVHDHLALPCSICRGKGELPGATVECNRCFGSLREYDNSDKLIRCKLCDGSGRIPAPILPSHHPITEVTFTTMPPLAVYEGNEIKRLRERWPSVEKWNSPVSINAAISRFENALRPLEQAMQIGASVAAVEIRRIAGLPKPDSI